jgi:hypothetical protein
MGYTDTGVVSGIHGISQWTSLTSLEQVLVLDGAAVFDIEKPWTWADAAPADEACAARLHSLAFPRPSRSTAFNRRAQAGCHGATHHVVLARAATIEPVLTDSARDGGGGQAPGATSGMPSTRAASARRRS